MLIRGLLGLGVLGLLGGCAATAQLASRPPIIIQEDVDAKVSVIPLCSTISGCSYQLTIQNKTDKDIEVNWNKTSFIQGGQTNGGFMFAGVVYKDRANPKNPDVVFAKSEFKKEIWPNALVEYIKGAGWIHKMLPRGDGGGVYLVLQGNGKELSYKLTSEIYVLDSK